MKIAGRIAAALLLMAYIVAFVGFRLHECAVDRTVELLPLLAGESCEDVHHHHCSDAAHCGHHHHHCAEDHQGHDADTAPVQISEADCCTNSLHCISDAQIVSDSGNDIYGAKCLPMVQMSVMPAGPLPVAANRAPAFCGAVSPLTGRTALALYSVRRV